MLIRKILLFVLVFTFFASVQGWSEELVVRPVNDCSGGACGLANGSDYDNAYNGLSDVTWGAGAGKVSAGDTLYVAGIFYGELLNPGTSGIDGSVITIRGDLSGHPGRIIGGSKISTWTQVGGTTDPPIWQAGYVHAGTARSLFFNGNSAQSQVTYANINMVPGMWNWDDANDLVYFGYSYDPDSVGGDGMIIVPSSVDGNINIYGRNYITIRNTSFDQGYIAIQLSKSDHIEINGCDFSNQHFAIQLAGNALAAVTNLIIANNNFHDLENITSGAYIYDQTDADCATTVSISYNKFFGGLGTGIYSVNSQSGWTVYNNLFNGNRNTGIVTVGGMTLKNNIFAFNSQYELNGTSFDAHTNNLYYNGDNPSIVKNDASNYDYTTIGAWESGSVVTNPFPGMITLMNRALHCATITPDGMIYAGWDDTSTFVVIKSTDNGQTWSTCGSLTFDRTAGNSVRFIDSDSNGNIYVSAVTSVAGERGLWRSANGGSTWTRVIAGTVGDAAGTTTAWAAGSSIWGFDEGPDGTLWVSNYGTNDGQIYKSVNQGGTWSLSYDASAIDTHIHKLAVDKTSGKIYFCVGDTTKRIYWSSIGDGSDWAQNTSMVWDKQAAMFGGPGYVLMGSDDASLRITRTTNGTIADIVWSASYSKLMHFYAFGGDTSTGCLIAAAAKGAKTADVPSALLFSSDAGVTWSSIAALAWLGSVDDTGYRSVSRTAVNNKVIVGLVDPDGVAKNAYMVDLSVLKSFYGRPWQSSPAINAGTDLGATYATDYDGNSQDRFGRGWEIGAYAFKQSPNIGIGF